MHWWLDQMQKIVPSRPIRSCVYAYISTRISQHACRRNKARADYFCDLLLLTAVRSSPRASPSCGRQPSSCTTASRHCSCIQPRTNCKYIQLDPVATLSMFFFSSVVKVWTRQVRHVGARVFSGMLPYAYTHTCCRARGFHTR